MLSAWVSRNDFIDTLTNQVEFCSSRQRTFIRLIAKNLPTKQHFRSKEVSEMLITLSLADAKKLIHFYYDALAIHEGLSLLYFFGGSTSCVRL